MDKTVVQAFRIGFAPQANDGLLKALVKRGFTAREVKEAGLAVERRGALGDMFRGRMMVPLSDAQGQVVGFTARIIEDLPDAPKYINTPQTLLYDKGRQLFGLHLAKEAIRKQDKAVIVEGNLDVVSSHQAGVANVVAAAGTALTEFHLRSLSRLTPHVSLAFDGDKAGLAATERAIELAQAIGIQLSVIILPEDAKDPDELIKKRPEDWQKAIDQSQPAVEWIIDRYSVLFDPSTATGKREVTTRALQVIRRLHDPVEKEHYMGVLSEVTGTSAEALHEKIIHLRSKEVTRPKKSIVAVDRKAPGNDQPYQDHLLALTVIDVAARDALRKLKPSDFTVPERAALLDYLQAHPTEPIDEDIPSLLHEHETYVKILLLQAETRYGDWSSQDRYFEAVKLVHQVQQEKIKAEKQTLIDCLRQAETEGDSQRVQQLLGELNNLIKEQKTNGT